MAILKLVIIAILVATVLTSPITVQTSYEDSGYSSTPTLSYSHTPLVSYSHVPEVSYSQVPVAVQHIPVETEHYAPANYEFKYGVHDSHTHDIKEQAERRHGDKVEGYYKLVEPDGTIRTVHYTADKHTGFHAQVQKSGHASHPTVYKAQAVPVISYAPSYGHSSGSSYGYASPSVNLGSYDSGSSYGYSAPSINSGSSHGLATSAQSYGTSNLGNLNNGHSSLSSYGGSDGYSSPIISYGGYGSSHGQSTSQSYGESY